MPGFRIRRASIRDLRTLVHHRHSMLAEMAPATPRQLAAIDRAYARFVRREMKAKQLICFLVETGEDKIAAGGAIWLRETPPRIDFPGGRIPYLMSMYTEPAYRGQGLATLIVNESVKWSRERGTPGAGPLLPNFMTEA